MPSEIRVDTLKNISGLGTITYSSNSTVFSGIISAINGNVLTQAVTDISGGYLSVPPGTVLYHGASTAPSGFLTCNGAEILITTYNRLYNVITANETTFPYGSNTDGSGGAGSTHFRLPDLRGEFIRGFDAGRGVDSGRVFGFPQGSQNLSHTHNDAGHYHAFYSTRYGTAAGGAGTPGAEYGSAYTTGFVETGVNVGYAQIVSDGGTESRPRNIALLPCIKY